MQLCCSALHYAVVVLPQCDEIIENTKCFTLLQSENSNFPTYPIFRITLFTPMCTPKNRKLGYDLFYSFIQHDIKLLEMCRC